MAMELKEKRKIVEDFFDSRIKQLEIEATGGLKTFKHKGENVFCSFGVFLTLGSFLENFSFLHSGRKISLNDSSKEVVSYVKDFLDSTLDLNVSHLDLHGVFEAYYSLSNSGLSSLEEQPELTQKKKGSFYTVNGGGEINLQALFDMIHKAMTVSKKNIISNPHKTEEVYELIKTKG